MASHLDAVRDWGLIFSTNNYCVKKSAAACGLTARQLERYFSQKFGCTPREAVYEARMKAAVTLLLRGKLVKEIAFTLGYRNPTHFIPRFRSFYGKPPLAFLASLNRNSKSRRRKS